MSTIISIIRLELEISEDRGSGKRWEVMGVNGVDFILLGKWRRCVVWRTGLENRMFLSHDCEEVRKVT